ncbi:MAG: hypothetical protein AAF958_10315, partial [Planctomycetota bacterium]
MILRSRSVALFSLSRNHLVSLSKNHLADGFLWVVIAMCWLPTGKGAETAESVGLFEGIRNEKIEVRYI